MSWSLYRWTWLLESPLYVGYIPAGSLNRCRQYISARAFMSALVAELARRTSTDYPNYQDVYNFVKEYARFTYLFPAEQEGGKWYAWLPYFEFREGLVWRREDSNFHKDCTDNTKCMTDRVMHMRLISTRPSTAIDPLSDTADEATLRETECINIYWCNQHKHSISHDANCTQEQVSQSRVSDENKRPTSPVALVGYVFIKDHLPNIEKIDFLTIGGDTRYGLGRLRRIEYNRTDKGEMFIFPVNLNDSYPQIESFLLLGHGNAPNSNNMVGQLEKLVGWNYEKGLISYPLFWIPGSRFDNKSMSIWQIDADGHWINSLKHTS
ncbi:hypothetical protein [Methylacidiphilum caldifontis]|uniref:Uncharacterized protein n=1 Tax=Methylacidiphilum caldifontis TaxID=2795386 RepID=A0A4Y8PBC4_9BACT|nr:hypothetical protein [Methylacidiphilum caldifontis]TFE67823.1 hypothetical protein A7Q10_09085 [Methylacidiphilum caldifontis]